MPVLLTLESNRDTPDVALSQEEIERHVGMPTDRSRTLLREAKRDHELMDDYRHRRRMARDQRRGRHWENLIDDPDYPGRQITEKEYIERQGRTAWQMNHTSPTIRNLVGQYLQNKSERVAYAVDREGDEEAELMTVALRAARRHNRAKELEVSQLEEHIQGGMCVWKVGSEFDSELDRDEIVFEAIDPARFFFNQDVSDRRLKGLRRIGEVHEVHIDELVAQLATSPEHAEAIRAVYGGRVDWLDEVYDAGQSYRDNFDFETGGDPNRALAYEIWTTEHRWVQMVHDPVNGFYGKWDGDPGELAAENAARMLEGYPELDIEMRQEAVWVYRILTDMGHVLAEGEEPYWHQSHPYVVSFAQWMDGEWWGLIEDIEDPQRLVNRMTTAIDHMLSASAKGVLLIDEEALSATGMSIEDIAEEWTKMNGVISLKLKPGMQMNKVVQQITASAIPSGIFEWLNDQKSHIQELSGVVGAQMGAAPKSGQPAAIYSMQQTTASLTTLIFFETFFWALHQLDKKAVQCIQQFYDRPGLITADKGRRVHFDPDKVRDAVFDMVVADSADTATYRQLFEESLKEFLGGGRITFRQFLEMSSHPKAGQLLKIIDRTNPMIEQATALDASPELVQPLMMAAQSGDMDAQTLLAQAGEFEIDQNAQMPAGSMGGVANQFSPSPTAQA